MGGEAVAVLCDPQRPAPRAPVIGCRLESLAAALSRLLPHPVTAADVRRRAVGLGLLRLPPDGAAPRLPPEKAARLLLTGYRLPAVAEVGTPATARAHLAAGRHVVLMSNGAEPGAVPLPEPCGAIAEAATDRLFAVWADAGALLVTAARRWEDLPAAPGRFFGGVCDRDGSYHWDAADCDTDAAGRILRLW